MSEVGVERCDGSGWLVPSSTRRPGGPYKCPGCTSCQSDAAVLREEEARVERRMTAREIFAAGFKLGLSKAGLTENADKAFDDWLMERAS